MSERKRANVFAEDDDSFKPVPLQKKPKGNSQAPPSYLPPPIPVSSLPVYPPAPSATTALQQKAAIDIAAKRAEIQAKLAAMRSKMLAPPTALPSSSNVASESTQRSSPLAGLPSAKANLDPDLAKKVADARAKVESMAKKRALAAGNYAAVVANPYLSNSSLARAPTKSEGLIDPALAARGGLAMLAHPLLMDNSVPLPQTKRERYTPMAPKFASTKANARLPPPPPRAAPPPPPVDETEADTFAASPFYDPRLSSAASSRTTMGRASAGASGIKFNQKGKFVRLGEAMRAEMKMEELKKRIMESARKAGLESEMEDQAKVIKRPPPPDIEWWDALFLPSKDYSSLSAEHLDTPGIITLYIQHPIPIPAPNERQRIATEPKALFLTKKEMKKMRRQRRAADLKDKQDRVKLGLLPPDPPKVKLSNMMRVLTADAISDPTKVEAQVRREMNARENGHIKMNAANKLTDEEKRKKKETKKMNDEKKGIGALCFKILYLANPIHKSKVRNNAQQDGLTGVVLYHEKFCLVVVEGGMKGLKHFKHLMLSRIDWTEEIRSRNAEAEDGEGDENNEDGTPAVEGAKPVELNAEGEPINQVVEPQSLVDNKCTLVWEGTHRERMFRPAGNGGLRQANCPTETAAKEFLGTRFEGLWDVAKKMDESED